MNARSSVASTTSVGILLLLLCVQCKGKEQWSDDLIVGEWLYSSDSMKRRLPSDVQNVPVLVVHKDHTATYRFLPGQWRIENHTLIFFTDKNVTMHKMFHPQNVSGQTFSLVLVYDGTKSTLTPWDARDQQPDASQQMMRKQ